MQSINKYYLVGIKGTGMSSLAKLLKEEGNEVVGSDVDEYYFTEDTLKEQEIEIKSFNRSNITKDYFYIIGNAFNKSNIEVDEIINQKNDYLYYHEFIGQKLNKKIIACSGTHGKTTTSFLLVDFLKKECNYIIGDGEGGSFDTDLLVLEACEYKEHFLSYHPELLIITTCPPQKTAPHFSVLSSIVASRPVLCDSPGRLLSSWSAALRTPHPAP